MSYEVIRIAADKLTYREKMKLAQYLIQAAIKEEENINPSKRSLTVLAEEIKDFQNSDKTDLVTYAKERLSKSKPAKTQSLKNFIGAMFQFQGGIEESKIESIVKSLEKEGFLTIDGTKVKYV